jgi:hypothetical protein
MRAAWVAILLAAMCVTVSACSSGGRGQAAQCSCPCVCFFITPQFTCPLADTPSLTLSGPCHQTGTVSTPRGAVIPLIGGTEVGTCRATLTLADGEVYSNDFTFAGQWSACGNNPHGCGEAFVSDASTWMIDNACADAGSHDARPDAASGDGY